MQLKNKQRNKNAYLKGVKKVACCKMAVLCLIIVLKIMIL